MLANGAQVTLITFADTRRKRKQFLALTRSRRARARAPGEMLSSFIESGLYFTLRGKALSENLGDLRQRRVTLPDGRYMIFYTFGTDVPLALDSAEDTPTTVAAPAPQPAATEEADV